MRIYGVNTHLDNIKVPVKKGKGKVTFSTKRLLLLSGQFSLDVAITSSQSEFMHFLRAYTTFEVVSSNRAVGYVVQDHNWVVVADNTLSK